KPVDAESEALISQEHGCGLIRRHKVKANVEEKRGQTPKKIWGTVPKFASPNLLRGGLRFKYFLTFS
ncbi:MAG: hypothetical protein MJ109_07285, partial [Kiritimatiellae bacterium]|nr:hypothetical protein [Kiritimatiellia bacterium]